MLPILYSYRRCPNAIRARMALKLAGIAVEIREISLREKPAHMLQVSPKATVPVLVLQNGLVIEESSAIMLFALKEHAVEANVHAVSKVSLSNIDHCEKLILENDTTFKQALDAYKYPDRFHEKSPIEYRKQGEVFLKKLEDLLLVNPYLLSAEASLADIAIFPFIRQFAAIDVDWFEGVNGETAPYPRLSAWLSSWVGSNLFKSIMTKNPTFVG